MLVADVLFQRQLITSEGLISNIAKGKYNFNSSYLRPTSICFLVYQKTYDSAVLLF